MPLPNQISGQDRLKLATTAVDLHARQLDEKTAVDHSKLGIEQQKVLVTNANNVANLALKAAALKQAHLRTLAVGALADTIGNLDVTDPKFEQKRAAAMAKYSDGLGSPVVKQLLSEQWADYQNFQKADHARILAGFNDPQVASAYDTAFQATGDKKLSNIAAESTKQSIDKAKTLMSSEYLSDQDKASIYNPQEGKFNLDPKTLTDLEIKSTAAKNAAAGQKQSVGIASAISNMLPHLQAPITGDEPADVATARQAGHAALSKILQAVNGQQQPAAPGGATSVSDDIKKYLGQSPAAAPSPAAAATPSALPAVTPAQAAGEPDAPITPTDDATGDDDTSTDE